MIEQLPGLSAGVVGVKMSDKLRHEDVGQVLQRIDEVVAKRGECRMLIVFGDFHGWDVQSLWDNLKFHRYHCDHVRQIAYVGDKRWEQIIVNQIMVNLSAPFTDSDIRYFDTSEIKAAMAWLGEA